MGKERLEAFSDGVMAILITIMILELKIPHDANPDALCQLPSAVLSYLLSFVYLGIYWNNHHHMFHATQHVSGGILWANLHLLFWLSLIPFATGWMGENHFAAAPCALYGVVLLFSAVAYWILQQTIIVVHGHNSLLKTAVGKDIKGKISPVLYLIAIPSAFFLEWVSAAIYIVVALLWLIPDRRIERFFKNK